MKALIERAKAMAERRCAAILDGMVRTAADELPGLSVEREEGGVAIRGRGIARRWIRDPRLRSLWR